MNHSKNPLHGIKLADVLTTLVDKYGWQELAKKVNINCFDHEPSIKSCLKFLRQVKYEWARLKVENVYIELKESEKEKE